MLSSNRLNTGDKLMITSSVIKDVNHVLTFRLSGTICKYIRLKSGSFNLYFVGWKRSFFLIKIGGKISCFE